MADEDTLETYGRLPAVRDFKLALDETLYRALPDDWLVAVADVVDSTQAIEAGRYKDINSLGASAIMAVLNASGDIQVPYVFGGDGASFVIPPDLLEPVGGALYSTQKLAQDGFGLKLRVGLVPVADIQRQGVAVKALRYILSDGVSLSMFAGGGMAMADQLVKDPANGVDYNVTSLVDIDTLQRYTPDYTGMQCRWNKLVSRNGVCAALLIQANSVERYVAAMDIIENVLGVDAERYHPVQPEQLSLARDMETLSAEAIIKSHGSGPIRRQYYQQLLRLQTLIGRQLFAFRLRVGEFDGGQYPAQLHANTDYRKFDDMLRMVVYITQEQASELRSRLNQSGLDFGMHLSSGALLTCLIFSYDNGHVHFIDGADGGYAMAARELKKKISENAVNRRVV